MNDEFIKTIMSNNPCCEMALEMYEQKCITDRVTASGIAMLRKLQNKTKKQGPIFKKPKAFKP